MARRGVVGLVALGLVILAVSGSVTAHYFRYFDNQKIRVKTGWDTEPPIAGVDNSITSFVYWTGNGSAITGLNLTITLTTGPTTKTFNLTESDDNPGNYTVELIPTVTGIYNATVAGTVGSVTIDAVGDLQQVEPATAHEYPTTLADPTEVSAQVQQVQSEVALQQAQIQALSSKVNSTSGGSKIPGFEAALALPVIALAALVVAGRIRAKR
ncbi:MAG: hypothetical protein ACYDDF_13485 [Thermoplasmatota archaeon]